VVLWLSNRIDGAELLARMRCRSKRCPECYVLYAIQIRNRICHGRSPNSRRALFASSYLYISKLGTDFRACRVALHRRGAWWVGVPLPGGRIAVVSDTPLGPEWQKIRDLSRVAGYLMKHHDKSRSITSSRGLNVAARTTSVWTLNSQIPSLLEKAVEELQRMGLHGHWEGVNCYIVEDAKPGDMQEFAKRMAA